MLLYFWLIGINFSYDKNETRAHNSIGEPIRLLLIWVAFFSSEPVISFFNSMNFIKILFYINKNVIILVYKPYKNCRKVHSVVLAYTHGPSIVNIVGFG